VEWVIKELKAADQMELARKMNSIQGGEEEIIKSIFSINNG